MELNKDMQRKTTLIVLPPQIPGRRTMATLGNHPFKEWQRLPALKQLELNGTRCLDTADPDFEMD